MRPPAASVRAEPSPSTRDPRPLTRGPLVVLGIDPGLRSMGFGLLRQEGEAVRTLDFGVLAVEPSLPLPQRLHQVFDAVTGLIERWQPHEVALEEAFVGVNKRVAVAMGEVRGAVFLAVAQAGSSVFEYSAAEVKRTVAGYGRGDKGQVQAMVRLQLRLAADPQPDHAADALAVALCHLLHRRAAAIETRNAKLETRRSSPVKASFRPRVSLGRGVAPTLDPRSPTPGVGGGRGL